MSELDLFEKLAELRRSFDLSFAEAQNTETPSIEALLLIRLGAEPYALRLSEVSGLFVDKKIVQLPSRVVELLGLIGLRGSLVPVYDLGALLGAQQSQSTQRWLITIKALPIALDVGVFEGYLRVPRSALIPQQGGQHWRYSQEVAQLSGGHKPLINLSAVASAAKARSREIAQKEQ